MAGAFMPPCPLQRAVVRNKVIRVYKVLFRFLAAKSIYFTRVDALHFVSFATIYSGLKSHAARA
jgi:hypothetical protein